MEIGEALKIVLELAKENIIEDCMTENDEDLCEEQFKQETAVKTVEDFTVKWHGNFPDAD